MRRNGTGVTDAPLIVHALGGEEPDVLRGLDLGAPWREPPTIALWDGRAGERVADVLIRTVLPVPELQLT